MADIDLYTGLTQEARKVSILLEEIGADYNPIIIDVAKGDQHSPEFKAINPNQKIPAIVDHTAEGGEPLAVFESAAIMLYLGEKYGKFLPKAPAKKYKVIEWLMVQSTGLYVTSSQLVHFARGAKEKIPYAIERYRNMTLKTYEVMDRCLSDSEYLTDEYSIADMSCYSSVYLHSWLGIELEEFPHLMRWYQQVGARPQVQAGNSIPPNPE